MTFTTPDVIADYLKMIENVQYSGSVQGDKASIILTNNNEETIRDVTLKVVMPALEGGYNVGEGRIVRTNGEDENVAIYISTDIPGQGTKKITVEPINPKEKINVTIPQYPTEGNIRISIKDMTGKPLTKAEVIIDTKYYSTDKNGEISIDLRRGIHSIRIQNPGFETYSSPLVVKGRIYALEQFF